MEGTSAEENDTEMLSMWIKIIESKLYSETTFKDFCIPDNDLVLSPLLDNSKIIKKVRPSENSRKFESWN